METKCEGGKWLTLTLSDGRQVGFALDENGRGERSFQPPIEVVKVAVADRPGAPPSDLMASEFGPPRPGPPPWSR
jgi:hypothetical protein